MIYFFLFVIVLLLIGGYLFINSGPKLPADINSIISQLQQAPIPDFITGETGKAINNGITIGYELIKNNGQNKGTIILIGGHSQILLDWPAYFYQPLVDAGYQVIRFDNRGVGSSDWMEDWTKKNAYTLEDMATDVIAILNRLSIPKAHVIGVSMGGMIAQRLAISHAGRVLSLTSIMSTGYYYDPELPGLPKGFYSKLIAVSLKYPVYNKNERNQLKLNLAIRHLLDGAGDYPIETKFILQRALYELRKRRGYNAKVMNQHSMAVQKSGSRYDELGQIEVPTLVIHGTTDPLVKFEHAQKYASMIPNATTLFIEGMGHDLPRIHAPKMITSILKNIEKAVLVN